MEYDDITAAHYAAWRPPLHQKILALAITPGKRFDHGLDVGCGTGQSTHALATFCDQVVGVDPSQQMIDRAQGDDCVRFLAQSRNNGKIDQGFLDGAFDVITFAGSLHYQKPEIALEEISWLASEPATIIVYDFNVRLSPVFIALGQQPEAGDYDHKKNFGELTKYGLKESLQKAETLSFSASAEELGHLLFSVRDWREGILSGYDYAGLVALLTQSFSGEPINLSADVFITRYGI